MNPTHQQILLAKYLHQRGEDALADNGMFSPGLAVSLFQDAVESLIGTIAKEVGATIPRNVAFDAYWDLIKNAPKANGRTLPPNGKMVQLNAARVSFKHYGNVPALRTAAGLQIHTEEFLNEASQTFFSLDFAALSQVELLSNQEVATHLRKAEDALKMGDSRTTLEECAKGHHVLATTMSRLVPNLPHNVSGAVRKIEPHGRLLQEVVRGISLSHAALRDLAVMTSLGLPLGEYIRFRAIAPAAIQSLTGKFEIIWNMNPGKPDDAEFAVRFVTTYAVALENFISTIPPEARQRLT